jgi:hypothetical protein
MAPLLEVTITHNLADAAEVAELFRRQLIALDWGRNGPNPNDYTGRAHTDVTLFHTMRRTGAAVIAAYKKATPNRFDRLVGLVEANAGFQLLKGGRVLAPEEKGGLLCLPLTKAQVVDSSANFLGNLAPRQCTVQPCGNRAKGRLEALVLGQESRPSVWCLHNRDVEWLVTNYLMKMCPCVWSGGQTFEDIDHAGFTSDGHELLAQTTVSESHVATKAEKLLRLAQPNRKLHFFGPADAAAQCPATIEYHPIEAVFSELGQTPAGRWLIDRMLGPHRA